MTCNATYTTTHKKIQNYTLNSTHANQIKDTAVYRLDADNVFWQNFD